MKTTLIEGVRLLEGNLLDIPIADATVCWVASLCFSDDMMRAIAYKLLAQGHKLRVVASLAPFPNDLQGFQLTEGDEHQYEMTWTARRGGTAKVYIYTRILS